MRFERRILALIILIVAVVLFVRLFETFLGYLSEEYLSIYRAHKSIVYALIAITVGAAIIQSLASATTSWLREKQRTEVFFVRNVIILFGYILLGFIVAALLGVSGESLMASATFSGLVIGLALQPVLSNFFSGILILVSGFVRPGQTVRLTGAFPLSVLNLPAYKFFSRDLLMPSLKGTVVEVGFMFTKLLDVDGQLVKVPNSMLLNSSVVAEEVGESRTIQVRYEFPIACNPDVVVAEVRKTLGSLSKDFKVYVEEQDDKQYYIVLIVAQAPPGSSTREYRSMILKEMVKTHRRLLKSEACSE